MSIPWVEILLFPGFTFIFSLCLIFEHMASRVYNQFRPKTEPMFIPLVSHMKLLVKGETKSPNLKNSLQGIIVAFQFGLLLLGSLVLPIALYDTMPVTVGTFGGNKARIEGVVGVLAFEGDIILLFGIIVLFSLSSLVLFTLGKDGINYPAMKNSFLFLLFDIPLMLAFAGPILARRSLSLSVLGEDIRQIVYFNKVYGLLILPLGLIIAIISLAFKFDRPFFNKLETKEIIGREQPLPLNWKYSLWNSSLRLLEMLLAGMIVTVFLWGGYWPIPHTFTAFESVIYPVNFIGKTAAVLLVTTGLKIMLPRLKSNQATNLCWKTLIPAALITLAITGGYIFTKGIN